MCNKINTQYNVMYLIKTMRRERVFTMRAWDLWDETGKVSTGEQVADAFTKSLPEPAFKKHQEVMLGNVEWEMDDECEDWGVDG